MLIDSFAILLPLAAMIGAFALTGRWRWVFLPFCIRTKTMTVERLGLSVTDAEDISRVNGVLKHFLGGFNAMITSPNSASWREFCDKTPVMFQPFAHEGVAMGYTLRSLFAYDAAGFERELVKRRPEYRYLYYVGLGFWSGMRKHSPARLSRITDRLDPMHRFLCYDGYGFTTAFFEHPNNPNALEKLNRFDGYARNAAYQGVGRALYFRFMADTRSLVDAIEATGEYAADVAAGVGLAATFVNPDRLDKAQGLAEALPEALHAHFHLGMCFALKARAINDTTEFEQQLARTPAATREAVWASIRECDRIELQVRSESGVDGYRRWRLRVTDWMSEHIEYPLRGIGTVKAASGPATATPLCGPSQPDR